ncbi:hypothetical protein BU26DRAFT_167195 [Trematosphaeria pertusa]|uniref:Uncharacterized protein n=1 Tax=Trematosphaeria pertusa TaxID=390896 RepID=A0A6A6HVS0_9PLEO|nr:uncharacterized protein BU26DRAFT_167195 [Trematosphaeria pertusa]KAF2242147.1 hypothetical protein BU26DRAFT_167195 [Trematosphaeria pertusa]
MQTGCSADGERREMQWSHQSREKGSAGALDGTQVLCTGARLRSSLGTVRARVPTRREVRCQLSGLWCHWRAPDRHLRFYLQTVLPHYSCCRASSAHDMFLLARALPFPPPPNKCAP